MFKAALVGIESYKGNVNLTNPASAADLNTIAGLTTGVVKATLVAATPITDVTVTALADVKTSYNYIKLICNRSRCNSFNCIKCISRYKILTALTKITEILMTENLVSNSNYKCISYQTKCSSRNYWTYFSTDLNTIAGLTTGVVKATLVAATPITHATVTALETRCKSMLSV